MIVLLLLATSVLSDAYAGQATRARPKPGELIPPAATAPLSAPRVFQIGHMRPEGADGPLTEDWFRRLKRFLESDLAETSFGLRGALASERYSGIAIVSAEGFNDLVRRMEIKWPAGLDCVFCPSLAYVREPSFDKDYEVVFQLKGPYDRGSADRGTGRYILRKGVIFVNSHHPLFSWPRSPGEKVPLALLAESFASSAVAVISSYSAAGYFYPCKELLSAGKRVEPRQPIFCGSSQEVVKMVLSDVVSMGVCEEGAIEDLLQRAAITTPAEQIAQIVHTTTGAPTDPVVFRRHLGPAHSDLGRRFKEAVNEFFRIDRPGQVRLEDSNDEAFRDLLQAWIDYQSITQEIESVEAH
ncbi:PhnD/SsuA/transferrin family substrate-binding protein [Candidatus Sumerlaeota bacterium]|nr:PhnD/SsuA/transferrin family substrate-binding protein [Candidatus Sumerlaeota bacterium]